MTAVMEGTSVVPQARQWCVDNRDRMVGYLIEHYPHLPAGKVEAMIDNLWDRLVARIVKEHGLSQADAERAQGRGLAFLARFPEAGSSTSPDEEEDLGWHNFQLYSFEYEAACEVLAGRRIHHLPNDVPGWQQASASDCRGVCDGSSCFGCDKH
ncbi:MAG TPA: hypothetical protein VFH06_04550 [Candidatus Saccharimonadales bacterium]|nr:hypothetical protein [Candidatus Saccharimonadales bacterium]